jgi:serine/threonine-protein kinase
MKPGDILAARYRLVRPLGEGGAGVVWAARQVTTERPVAVKVLRGGDPANAARFLREARVAASLNHRNIVQVFDFWEVEDGGPVFLVMELLAGETLGAVLERVGRLSVPQTLSVATPIAAALKAAHAMGVVHRDLKPDNVFLVAATPDEPAVEVKVLDFGLAKPVTADPQATVVTQTGSVMGTPCYMSPEQVYGERDVDVRADVWALGVVLYECLTGTKPFVGENFGQVFRSITQGAPPPVRALAPDVPPTLSALVARMLSPAATDRPRAEEVLLLLTQPAELRANRTAVLEPLPLRTQRLSSSPPFAHGASSSPAPRTMLASATSVQRERKARWSWWLTVAAAMALLGLGAAALVVLTQEPPPNATTAERVTLPEVPASPAPAASALTPDNPPLPTSVTVPPVASFSQPPVVQPDASTRGVSVVAKKPGTGHDSGPDPLDLGRF